MLPLFLTFVLSSTKNSHQSCLLLLFRISLLNALLCSSQRNAPLTPPSASLRKNQYVGKITQRSYERENMLSCDTPQPREVARLLLALLRSRVFECM